jgi:hypothetical protein
VGAGQAEILTVGRIALHPTAILAIIDWNSDAELLVGRGLYLSSSVGLCSVHLALPEPDVMYTLVRPNRRDLCVESWRLGPEDIRTPSDGKAS